MSTSVGQLAALEVDCSRLSCRMTSMVQHSILSIAVDFAAAAFVLLMISDSC